MSDTVVWIFTDDKKGHRSQLKGFVDNWQERRPLECHWISIEQRSIISVFKYARTLPRPHFILGAGAHTHKYMIASKVLTGGTSIVLSKPSYPLNLFDLVIVPEHDGVKHRKNVLESVGVLNVAKPYPIHNAQEGIILIGGPSKHHSWDEAHIAHQVKTIVEKERHITWTISNSRRTPKGFFENLNLKTDTIQFISYNDTNENWIIDRLSRAGHVWVSEDSITMIYESLTCGAPTAVLEVPSRTTKANQRLQGLFKKNWISSFQQWQQVGRIETNAPRLDEARRCAEIVDLRFK